MMRLSHVAIVALCASALSLQCARAEEESAVLTLEEIVVEETIDLRLELPKESAVQIMIDRLTLQAETRRALDLEIANRTPLTTILDLTKYVPIPAFSGSSKPVDTFFLENHMRPDLNPREENALFEK
jgi:hypothetical protein